MAKVHSKHNNQNVNQFSNTLRPFYSIIRSKQTNLKNLSFTMQNIVLVYFGFVCSKWFRLHVPNRLRLRWSFCAFINRVWLMAALMEEWMDPSDKESKASCAPDYKVLFGLIEINSCIDVFAFFACKIIYRIHVSSIILNNRFIFTRIYIFILVLCIDENWWSFLREDHKY